MPTTPGPAGTGLKNTPSRRRSPNASPPCWNGWEPGWM
nr:MAG TPA: hypothetical protein [Caudoviricetes sp.]DAY30312.1 MAG TPA: hypothetical protein [Caudoviricetes sp.]